MGKGGRDGFVMLALPAILPSVIVIVGALWCENVHRTHKISLVLEYV